MNHLYAIRVKEIFSYLRTQNVLFWLVNIYLFFEYVRPQTMYPSLAILPFGQIILLISLGLLFFRSDTSFVKNPSNKILLLFFLVVFLSSILALSPEVAFSKISEVIAWIIIYFLIINIVNTEKRFLVFMLAFLLYSFKMAQFAFRGWAHIGFGFSSGGTGGGPGWFHNSGEFGIQMCVFLPLAFYFYLALKEHWPMWKKGFFLLFPVFAVTGAVSSSSRGALLGVGAVMLWVLFKSRHKLKGLIVLGVVSVLVIAFIPPEQRARFDSVGDDGTSTNRIERWAKGLKMAERYPVFGVGYANWGVADRAMFGGDGDLSHNVFIESLSELGYSGLAVFGLMILFVFINNHQTRKMASETEGGGKFLVCMAHGLDAAMVGFLVSGFFVTVLYYPYFWINLAMTVALNGIVKNRIKIPVPVKPRLIRGAGPGGLGVLRKY